MGTNRANKDDTKRYFKVACYYDTQGEKPTWCRLFYGSTTVDLLRPIPEDKPAYRELAAACNYAVDWMIKDEMEISNMMHLQAINRRFKRAMEGDLSALTEPCDCPACWKGLNAAPKLECDEVLCVSDLSDPSDKEEEQQQEQEPSTSYNATPSGLIFRQTPRKRPNILRKSGVPPNTDVQTPKKKKT